MAECKNCEKHCLVSGFSVQQSVSLFWFQPQIFLSGHPHSPQDPPGPTFLCAQAGGGDPDPQCAGLDSAGLHPRIRSPGEQHRESVNLPGHVVGIIL